MKTIKTEGSLRKYLVWPWIFAIILAVPAAGCWILSIFAGITASSLWLFYMVLALVIWFRSKRTLRRDLIDFATRFSQVQKGLLKGLAIPYALLDEDGRFIWSNAGFAAIIHKDRFYSRSITAFFPEISKDNLPKDDKVQTMELSYENRDYRVDLRRIRMDEDNDGVIGSGDFSGSLIAVFFFDITDVRMYMRLNHEQSLVSGMIYLDNYEEALESVEDVRRSLLTALIDRKINKYFHALDAIVKKVEKDKYFVVMKRISFEQMREARFDILEEVKTVNIGNQMAVTLSIGFGLDTDSFMMDNEYARNAIDLALGRGGDQAVVKSPEKITYYGGKSQQVEKSTRVKARVKAHALREIIESKDQIFVMGHKVTDIDSFGASVGIYRAADVLHKSCHIVINDVTASIRPFMEAFINDKDYSPEMFVTSSEALQLCDENSVVVVVDTNKPDITECPELLDISKTIVVLDHHRISATRINNATLSYIESYASSACEMVSEILQYIADGIKIRNAEADSLYAGIMIDTNNFMTKTGVRTFEAAAFLRRNGADTTRVRKLFRNEFADYKARAEAVKNAELYKGKYAISVCPNDVESPTVTGAQAANELLNINLVKASFILTEYQDKIFISARSIDEVNVQIIMEKLGGGGHMNIAGAQIVGKTVEEVREILKKTLDEMETEGELS
ncbi:c-di-AMP phosphodiesterase, consists of a GGDEF-like and DHH domains [Lachnospiraceae bacterium]|nr:c-di-AMP phosphodiesterase, consists of a GGDEF-like and DHH domains [Lachnospiraceae bacterium]